MVMTKKTGILLCMALIVLLAAKGRELLHPVTIAYPSNWPNPAYDFKKNPLTAENIALGRELFYDPVLSNDNTISCSNCHLSYTSFTHVDHALSHGIHDSVGTRNSPVLINLAWNKFFMWDGAINHLDVQALAPISHPAEMGEDLVSVIKKLQTTRKYPPLFMQVYGDSNITGEHVLKSLAQFQLTLISCNSKYDQVMRKEPGIIFSEQEANGYQLFKTHCNGCHQEPLFTNGEFTNNGLPVDAGLKDIGRMKISLNPTDSLKFKVPTLRNIEFSYPYMHDGRFKTLYQVLNHYTNGIAQNPTLHPLLKNGITLNENDKIDIVTFLLTLTDKEFLFNPAYGFPKK
jgi:cytochrome c peroxidase